MLKLKQCYNMQLIHSNDSHYIYPEQAKDRVKFLKGKGINYGDEDSFVLDFPNYDTVVERYKKQGFIISALTICGCDEENNFKSISLSEIKAMLSDGETAFVLYSVEDCSACEDAKERLSEIRKTYPELNVRCIDGDSEDGRALSKEYDIPYAPYLICIKNGGCFLSEGFTEEKLNSIVGLTEDSEAERFEISEILISIHCINLWKPIQTSCFI